jgi:hypothetical protein
MLLEASKVNGVIEIHNERFFLSKPKRNVRSRCRRLDGIPSQRSSKGIMSTEFPHWTKRNMNSWRRMLVRAIVRKSRDSFFDV